MQCILNYGMFFILLISLYLINVRKLKYTMLKNLYVQVKKINGTMKTAQLCCPPVPSFLFPGYFERRHIYQGLGYLVWIIWFLLYIGHSSHHVLLLFFLFVLYVQVSFLLFHSFMFACLFGCSIFLRHFPGYGQHSLVTWFRKSYLALGRCWEKNLSGCFVHTFLL